MHDSVRVEFESTTAVRTKRRATQVPQLRTLMTHMLAISLHGEALAA